MNETLQIIRNRRSIRAFKNEQIKEEELNEIIEAAIYAPSASNKQPWHFTVVQNKELLDLLNKSFKELAKKSDNDYIKRVGDNENYHVFYNAPTVIIVSGDENNNYAAVDTAAAVENMLLAAEAQGIGGCWIGFIAYVFNSEEGREFSKKLGIPEGYKQIHAAALGYKKINRTIAPARKENSVNYIR
ncbi:nitroreductase family protein [Candidatus Clostridium radicumherbarum]|uniref:Nitroreductase family protein n=1 Tax=Candidatus Clostridium radicumherbarum TaxID=3381662 RepID=A0ABW8TQG6_9CLOT